MRRSYTLYLEDILVSVEQILEYAGNLPFEDMLKDRMRIDAIVRNLEIIGEAAGKVPQEVKDKYPAVEWRKISDFRNVLIHEYFEIDYEIMWDIIKNKVPELKKDIQLIIEREKK